VRVAGVVEDLLVLLEALASSGVTVTSSSAIVASLAHRHPLSGRSPAGLLMNIYLD
jgi:hypothetical protein